MHSGCDAAGKSPADQCIGPAGNQRLCRSCGPRSPDWLRTIELPSRRRYNFPAVNGPAAMILASATMATTIPGCIG